MKVRGRSPPRKVETAPPAAAVEDHRPTDAPRLRRLARGIPRPEYASSLDGRSTDAAQLSERRRSSAGSRWRTDNLIIELREEQCRSRSSALLLRRGHFATSTRVSFAARRPRDPGRRIVVGLVNNMPDAALAATERQFAQLLEDGGAEFDLRLRLYALESVPRGHEARRAMRDRYHQMDSLRATWHDALIVTGAEPRAQSLPEEVYWRETHRGPRPRAGANAFDAFLMPGGARGGAPLGRHRSNSSDAQALRCLHGTSLTSGHALLDGLPETVSTPHSRLNGLDEESSSKKGYSSLIRSERAGVEVFVRDEAALLVFLQGHPEYEANLLAREFRCVSSPAISRVNSTRRRIPPMNYFAPDVLTEVESLIRRARRERRRELAELFPPAALNANAG